MIDAHIHLDQYDGEEIKDRMKSWQENGIDGVVAVATNLRSSYEILKLKQDFPTFIRAAIGHHPEIPPPSKHDLDELTKLVKSERHNLSGIGEIGLPTYRKEELLERNREEEFNAVLETFLKLAKDENLPVALHAVHEESKKVLAFLKKHSIQKAHFHWLKAPNEVIDEIVSEGYYVSVTPEVCYRERDKRLVMKVPVDRLLFETDGPWQHGGPFARKETSPLLLKEISRSVSNITNIPLEDLNRKISNNTNRLYSNFAGNKS
jgi:TatD DNase family protein